MGQRDYYQFAGLDLGKIFFSDYNKTKTSLRPIWMIRDFKTWKTYVRTELIDAIQLYELEEDLSKKDSNVIIIMLRRLN